MNKNKIDTAMILAAGLGTRMEHLTVDLPKPLLPLKDTTILDLIIKKLTNDGFRKIVINLHYKGKQIKQHLEKYRSDDVEFIFSDEPEILGTAGGIAKAEPYFIQQDILIQNSDVLSDISIPKFIEFFEEHQNIAALAVYPSQDNQNYSLVTFNEDQVLTGFLKKGETIPRRVKTGIFMGFQILSERARQYLKPYYSSIIEELYLKAVEGEIKISVYVHTGNWFDLGTKQNYYDFLEMSKQNPTLLEGLEK
jgi:mannose-1-phosphate guanylyltransferase